MSKKTENILLVDVGIQENGYTFRLNPKAQNELKDMNPEFNCAQQLFISFDVKTDLENYFGPIWQEVLHILSGLSDEELKAHHFVNIEFRNPINKDLLKTIKLDENS
jgi:hypothetical protein